MPYKDPIRRREYGREQQRKRRLKHPEENAMYAQRWRDEHPGHSLKHLDEYRPKNKAYRQAHPEKSKEWIKANPLRRKWQTLNSNSKRRGFEGRVSFEDFLAMWQACGDVCPVCQQMFTPVGKSARTFDHIDPDGPHLIQNLRIICRRCNRIKAARAAG